MRYLPLYFLVFCLVSCSLKETSTEKVSHRPVEQVAPDQTIGRKDTCFPGDLFRLKDSADFAARFGGEQTMHDSLWTEEGTVLRMISQTTDFCPEITVCWGRKDFTHPDRVIVRHCSGQAPTDCVMAGYSGVRTGMTLEELVHKNGREIQFAGFEWDYSGAVTSFEGGKLGKQGIRVFIGYPEEHPSYPASMIGDRLIRSDAPEVDRQRLRVVRIELMNPLYID